MSPTTSPITAPTRTSKGVCPRSSRSRASWTPRMCTRSSTSRFNTSAWRPAARRNPAASYITTNVKIRAIAKAAEPRPEYLPIAVVRPMTIALWLLGMPPVSARTRRFRRRCRTEVSVTLAACASAQATMGARRNLTQPAILPFLPLGLAAAPAGSARRPAAWRRAGAPPRARPGAPNRRPGRRSSSRAQTGSRRTRARARSSRGRGHPAEDAVDEAAGLVAGERLRELDRFVDRCLGRHLPVDRDLVDRDPQDDAIDLRHLLEPPVLGRFAQDPVEPLPVGDDALHELAREIRDVLGRCAFRRVVSQHVLRIVGAAFQLKEDLERELARLVALTRHAV